MRIQVRRDHARNVVMLQFVVDPPPPPPPKEGEEPKAPEPAEVLSSVEMPDNATLYEGLHAAQEKLTDALHDAVSAPPRHTAPEPVGFSGYVDAPKHPSKHPSKHPPRE